MLTRLFWQASTIELVATLLFGCSSGDDGTAPDNTRARTDWSQAACNYTARCTQPVPSTCVASLQSQNASFLSNVTTEFLEAFAACLNGAECAADWSTAAGNCEQKSALTVTASTGVVDMCKAKAAKFFDCNWQDADLAACTQDYAPLSDTAAQRLSNCSVTICDDLKTCINDAFNG